MKQPFFTPWRMIAGIVGLVTAALIGLSLNLNTQLQHAERAANVTATTNTLLYAANGGIEWAVAQVGQAFGRCDRSSPVTSERTVPVPIVIPGIDAVRASCVAISEHNAGTTMMELTVTSTAGTSSFVEHAIVQTVVHPLVVTVQRWWVSSSAIS